MGTSAQEFVWQVAALCREGRHADAVAYADRHASCWSVLALDQLGAVCAELIDSALASRVLPASPRVTDAPAERL